jgi:hypothetical protein
MMTKEETIQYVENEANSLNTNGVADSYRNGFIGGARFGAGCAHELFAEGRKKQDGAIIQCEADRNERELREMQVKYAGMRCRAERAELELEHARQEVSACDTHRDRLKAELINLHAENAALRNRPILRELPNETAPTPEKVLTVEMLEDIFETSKCGRYAPAREYARDFYDFLKPYLASTQIPQAVPEPDTREEWEHCPNPNHTNHPRDRFCIECGKSLIKRFRKVTLYRWSSVTPNTDGTWSHGTPKSDSSGRTFWEEVKQ